ncbi:DUF6563 family protein [Spirosoma endophyticum]|uniref:Uncharacterized protein n=1 Tax=Spirosoma endophyticum TaxID=662367 RepID=A0A1I1MJK5_9BACT|nr:DUF6563 family protein [Spirosoma endophyticum]SFC82823.1 hypothetical protein SAMN05216167_102523 [Spirosoma endophyticum]
MNHFFTLLIFLLINSGLVFAQKPNIFNVPLEIDLRVSPKGRLFSVDTIINARVDTSINIGVWQRPSGDIIELCFEEGFRSTLTNFIFPALANFDNKFSPYSLVINEFNLSSANGFNRFELAVLFCRRNGIKQIDSTVTSNSSNSVRHLIPIYKADIIVESSGDSDVNNFTELIKEGLSRVFIKFNKYLANPKSVPPVYSDFSTELAKASKDLKLTQTTYDSIRTNDDNLLHRGQFRPGVYRSFNDLALNQPSLTGDMLIVIDEKKDFAVLRKPSGSRANYRFFCFSDGKNLFINTKLYLNSSLGQQYAKVLSIGRYLLWIDNYLTSNEMATRAVLGVVGSVIANSDRDCIALDMQTGGVFMVTKDKLPQMLAGHNDLLDELASMPNKKDEQQQFLLLDKLNQRSRSTATR